MEVKKKSFGNDFTEFMGSWMSGIVAGHFIFKLLIWGAIAWGLVVLFPGLAKFILLVVVGVAILSWTCHKINKKIDKGY